MSVTDVAIIGASGYTGLELIKILIKHPYFNIAYVANSEGGLMLSELHPSLLNVFECKVHKVDIQEIKKHCKLVFLALPHKTAMAFVAPLLTNDLKIIDLSADYRLSLQMYEKFYCKHIDKKNLKNAIYGLPELNKEKIKKARLVANPGCYPTCSVLGILPFIEYIQKNTSIIIDAKSGVSGAGKKLSDVTHFVNIYENFFAYNPFEHRHAPEIAEVLDINFEQIHFVPHLVPVTRGMMASIYLHVKDAFDALDIIKKYYADNPYIRIRTQPVDMKNVAGTHFCDIFVKRNGNILFISCAIDNLLRGASSTAVSNANLMMGYDEYLALPSIAYVP